MEIVKRRHAGSNTKPHFISHLGAIALDTAGGSTKPEL